MHKTPGVDMSSGALGLSLSVASGMALGARKAGKDLHVWTVLGNGETQEGQVLEAVRVAGVQRLNNLTVIIDANGQQIEGDSRLIDAANVAKVWEGYGWHVIEVNGHDPAQLLKAMTEAKMSSKPTCIIAKTVKGKGIPFIEANPVKYHGGVPEDKEMQGTLTEIETVIGRYGPTDIEKFIRTTRITGQEKGLIDRANVKEVKPPRTIIALKELKVGDKWATRAAFGEMMAHCASIDPRLVVVSADLGTSHGLTDVRDKLGGRVSSDNPDGQYVAAGISEAFTIVFAGGLSLMGYVPVAAAYDMFLLNGVLPWRTLIQNKVPVILVGSSSGVAGGGQDGMSHESVDVPGVMLSLSQDGVNLSMYEPGDAEEARKVAEIALGDVKSGKPVYIRVGGNPVEVFDKSGIKDYEERVREGSYVLRDPGNGRNDLIIVATGATVNNALKASEALERQGKKVKVINVVSINRIGNKGNPFLGYLEDGVPIITVHDAYPGVLKDSVLSAGNAVKEKGVNIGIVYPIGATKLGSASWQDLYAINGLDKRGIEKTARKVMGIENCVIAVSEACNSSVKEMVGQEAHNKIPSIEFFTGENVIDTTCQLAQRISKGEVDNAVLVADSEEDAMLMQIAANRFLNVRAALCRNEYQAQHSRSNNHANILIVINDSKIATLVREFFNQELKEDREPRVREIDPKIRDLEDLAIDLPAPGNEQVISIASDYAGFNFKKAVIGLAQQLSPEVLDLGSYAGEGTYPEFGKKAAVLVSRGDSNKAVLVCKTGNGMAMVANKFPGVYAALCLNPEQARLAMKLGANLLVVSTEFSKDEIDEILKAFLTPETNRSGAAWQIETVLENYSGSLAFDKGMRGLVEDYRSSRNGNL